MVQPNGTTQADSDTQDTNNTVVIDWEEVTLDSIREWKKGHMLQSDYTKKTQELAKQRKELESQKQSELSDDEKQLLWWLKEHWVQTDFNPEKLKESIKAEVANEQSFRTILLQNPDLARHEKAIKDLQKQTGAAYEDIIVNYWFSTTDKLSKAKSQSTMVGDRWLDKPKTKSIKDMSPEEYLKRKKSNVDQSGKLKRVSSF